MAVDIEFVLELRIEWKGGEGGDPVNTFVYHIARRWKAECLFDFSIAFVAAVQKAIALQWKGKREVVLDKERWNREGGMRASAYRVPK